VTIFVFLKYRKEISMVIFIVTGGILVVFGVFYVVAVFGSVLYEGYTSKQCLTAHERAAE